MSQAHALHALSIADYLNFEADGSLRHEYMDGQVYAMAGGSIRHNLIAVNAGSVLNTRLPAACEVFVADMKVRIREAHQVRFYYPDVMVCCREEDNEAFYRQSPCLIIEVLSNATERQDRFEKSPAYIRIETLQEYLLIHQNYPQATVFRRANAWRAETYREGDLYLASVGITTAFDTLYRRVRF
uniref:Endonuclease, Uma2 family (Restriction endonuclease fold) n=1 Tax=Candidatus Kentrum eta TaxID=2126337 RepID=A0A450UN02_9GAMM|nr:MAG: Endonuclease, Uma2 family (restriction endonuclease fold) [Candidatus Kentron sp. H]VFJ94685.1 MAG: Endonuclease, Uma2 family (restriction endonuclease fold) [Candidatus Kentron sp. H]VFK01216.1 MAG: Endonuclease, Uma2 family (restriction endonuclease fold) [Candidatus Kentron sp. H]